MVCHRLRRIESGERPFDVTPAALRHVDSRARPDRFGSKMPAHCYVMVLPCETTTSSGVSNAFPSTALRWRSNGAERAILCSTPTPAIPSHGFAPMGATISWNSSIGRYGDNVGARQAPSEAPSCRSTTPSKSSMQNRSSRLALEPNRPKMCKVELRLSASDNPHSERYAGFFIYEIEGIHSRFRGWSALLQKGFRSAHRRSLIWYAHSLLSKRTKSEWRRSSFAHMPLGDRLIVLMQIVPTYSASKAPGCDLAQRRIAKRSFATLAMTKTRISSRVEI